MNDMVENIYEKMSKQRLEIAACQIDILLYYNNKSKEKRTQELYKVSHKSIINKQSEKSLVEMEKLIDRYNSEIRKFRRENPEIEKSEDVKIKLDELEKLCRLYSL